MRNDFTDADVAKFREVATLLRGGYGSVTQPHGRWSVHLDNVVTGADLSAHIDNGRYVISGYVRSKSAGTYYFTRDEQAAGLKSSHEITVAATKSAEQIARDITRRLLPNYLQSLALVEGYDARVNARQASKENGLAALRAVGGELATITRDRDDYPTAVSVPYDASKPYGDFKATQWDDRTEYAVELRNVAPELAARIMALLVEARS